MNPMTMFQKMEKRKRLLKTLGGLCLCYQKSDLRQASAAIGGIPLNGECSTQ